MIDKTYIEKAVKTIQDDEQIGIVYCKARRFGEINIDWNLPEFSIDKMLRYNIIFATSLFRKSDWEKVGGYCEDLVYGLEDYDFWLSILELGRNVYRIPEILFFYRSRKNSMIKQYSKLVMDKQIYTQTLIMQRHKQLYTKNLDVLIDMYLTERKKIAQIKNKLGFIGEFGWKVYKKFLDR